MPAGCTSNHSFMADFKHGDPVRIHRPNKQYHGWLARYSEKGGEGFGFVAFSSQDKHQMPDLDKMRNQGLCPRKLFPLSQIQPYTPVI